MQLEECRGYAEQGCLTAAERNGIKAEGFDLGNSPFAYMNGNVKGRTVAITTTNGTRAIRMSAAAQEIIVGAFLNLEAVARHLRDLQLDVLVVCAGWKGKFNLEDTLFAGAVASRLRETGHFENNCDTAQAACHLYDSSKGYMYGFLENSSHRRRLEKLNLEKDVRYCLQNDVTPVIPILQENEIVRMQLVETFLSDEVTK
jgi:2-phosphosulfolactate phosphatase